MSICLSRVVRLLMAGTLLLLWGFVAYAQTFLVNGKLTTLGTINTCAATATGGPTAYACSIEDLTGYQLSAWTVYRFVPDVANTGAATVNFNSLGAKALKKWNGTAWVALVANDLRAGHLLEVTYDGTDMRLLTQSMQVDVQTLTILVGDDDPASPVLTDAKLGPQLDLYMFPRAVTIHEISVRANTGTPNVIVHKRSTGGTNTNLLSAALATGASGAFACARVSGDLTSVSGATCGSATLQNTPVAAGETLGLTSGTAGGAARRLAITVVYVPQ